jgi:sugar/nucleoside kinase (ribokinase family)
LDYLDTFAPDGKTHAAHLLSRASSAGLTTSIDLVSAAHPQFREIVQSSLPYSDYLFLNEIEAGNILGKTVSPSSWEEIASAAKDILAQGVRQAVILHTEHHAATATSSGEIHQQSSLEISPSEIRGANGAGDAFAAGFLHAIHEGKPIPEALKLAVKAAAQCLTHPTPSGGITPH